MSEVSFPSVSSNVRRDAPVAQKVEKKNRVTTGSELSKKSVGAAGLLLLIFSVLCLSDIWNYSPTYDELKFLKVGQELSSGEGWQTEMSVVHAPLSFYTHGFLLKLFHFSNELQRLRWARVVMLLYALALGALVFKWAAELFGPKGGLLALGLYVFNSNILAHSSLITTDVIYACFSLFLLYFLWRLMTEGRLRWAFACGVSLGLALLSKYSAVFWFLLIPVLALFLALYERFSRRQENDHFSKIRPLKSGLAIIIIFLCAMIILNIGYGFSGSFFQLGSKHYQSRLLAGLSSSPLTSWIPAPVPYPFARGYDAQKYISEVGHPSFLAGHRSTTGWWYYFPLALFLKMPLAFWPLILLALAMLAREENRRRKCGQFLLLATPIAIIIAHSVLSRSQAGLRYILWALPPLFILAGAAAKYQASFLSSRWSKAPVLALVFLCAVPAIWIHPHHLAYFSRIIGGPRNGYKWLSDSNLDWGQDTEKAIRYARDSKTPVSVNPGSLPIPGRILINATSLQDCFTRNIHGWLREFEPDGNIGYSWLIFDIDEESVRNRPRKVRKLPDEYYFAAFEYSRNRLQNANDFARETLIKRPHLPEALYLFGLIQTGLGKFDDATTAFEAIPQSHPLYVDARSNLSFIAAVKGDGESSKKFQTQAVVGQTELSLAVKPEFASTSPENMTGYKFHNNRGVSLWMQGDMSEAEREIRTALEIQPHFVEGFANLATILEERGAFLDAFEACRKYYSDFLLLENSSYRNYRVYYQGSATLFGDTLEIFPKPDEEIIRLEASLALHPNDPAALNQLAVLLMKAGRFGAAYECLQRGIAAGIGADTLYNNLAVLYMDKKMFPDAVAACRRALQVNPGNSATLKLLSFLQENTPGPRLEQDQP
jgi:tetratricopeptide (TPR) repeat protein/4-amino-4-deoxy-L-arabinose transferase-like glycosyltransferase